MELLGDILRKIRELQMFPYDEDVISENPIINDMMEKCALMDEDAMNVFGQNTIIPSDLDEDQLSISDSNFFPNRESEDGEEEESEEEGGLNFLQRRARTMRNIKLFRRRTLTTFSSSSADKKRSNSLV
jgi:hypothetical protein